MPAQRLVMRPWWLNFVENTAAIQFVHRWLVVLVLLAAGGFAARLIRAGWALIGYALLAVVCGQVALGIAPLLLRVPVVLGVAPQAGAILLLTVVVIALAGSLPSLARD